MVVPSLKYFRNEAAVASAKANNVPNLIRDSRSDGVSSGCDFAQIDDTPWWEHEVAYTLSQ